MHRDTIDRLRQWLALAESDRSLGDERGARAKLLVARAEIENALGMSRSAAPAKAREYAHPLKLTLKYATAGFLLIIAAALLVRSQFAVPEGSAVGGGAVGIAKTAQDGQPAAFPAEGAGTDGAIPVKNEVALIGIDTGTEIVPPEGRLTILKSGGKPAVKPASVAPARIPEEISESLAPAETHSAPAVAADEKAAPDKPAAEPADSKKALALDPLSLIAALDSHFD